MGEKVLGRYLSKVTIDRFDFQLTTNCLKICSYSCTPAGRFLEGVSERLYSRGKRLRNHDENSSGSPG